MSTLNSCPFSIYIIVFFNIFEVEDVNNFEREEKFKFLKMLRELLEFRKIFKKKLGYLHLLLNLSENYETEEGYHDAIYIYNYKRLLSSTRKRECSSIGDLLNHDLAFLHLAND